MNKKIKIDMIVSAILIIIGGITMLMPLLNFNNIKIIFISIMTIYVISNIINYILVKDSKDTEGLYTAFISLLSIGLVLILDISAKPVYLAIVLLVWALGMALVKLKKADYYHDRKDAQWILHIVLLFIFILVSLLTTINLYYSNEIQLLMLGNFFLINGILDICDPLICYIKEQK